MEGHQQNCKAKAITCSNCRKVGHLRKQCMGNTSGASQSAGQAGGTRLRQGGAAGGFGSSKKPKGATPYKGKAKAHAAEAKSESESTDESDSPPGYSSNYANTAISSFAVVNNVSVGQHINDRVTVSNTSKVPLNAPLPPLKVRVYEENRSKYFDFKALGDTGANRSIIDVRLLKKHSFKWKKGKGDAVKSFTGDVVRMLGTVVLEVRYSSFKVKMDMLVAEELPMGILISWYDMVRLRLIRRKYSDLGPDPKAPDPDTDCFKKATPFVRQAIASQMHAALTTSARKGRQKPNVKIKGNKMTPEPETERTTNTRSKMDTIDFRACRRCCHCGENGYYLSTSIHTTILYSSMH